MSMIYVTVICSNDVCNNVLALLFHSKQRHNCLWRSVSTGKLAEAATAHDEGLEVAAGGGAEGKASGACNIPLADYSTEAWRPRSWSPEDGPGELLLKARRLGGRLIEGTLMSSRWKK